VNLAPMDLVLDYIILGYLRAKRFKRIFSVPEWAKEFLGTVVCGDKKVTRVDLRVVIRLV
jgi:hypothetical protein